MLLKYKTREIQIEINFEYGEGTTVQCGHYTDTNVELTDAECEEIQELHQDELYSEGFQNEVCHAEAWADAMEDR